MDTKEIISNMYRWRSLPRNEVWSAAGVFLRTSVLTGSKFEMGLNKCPMPFGTNLSCSVRISIFSHVLVKMSLNVPRDVKSEHTQLSGLP